jgi:ArsR family transcriptional regulator
MRVKSPVSDAHRFFQALADSTRLRCLLLMVAETEVCVCEMTHALGEIQPKISRHLAALRAAGFILDRRDAQWIYYRLHPDLPAWMHEVLQATYRALADRTPFRDDRAALADMPNRPQRRCAA